ncbi:MAG: PilX N-terminal domain-containing pilus assembly protein [bacterium]|jgi:Tfp pilus assembly protein PilX
MKTVRNEQGSAMIITLMLLIILTALGIYAVSISTTEMSMSYQWRSGAVGFNAAESGIYRAFDNVGPALGVTSWSSAGTLPNGGQYTASGELKSMNLAPGNAGNFRMAGYEINATGAAPGSAIQRRLQAVVEYGPMPVGTMY